MSTTSSLSKMSKSNLMKIVGNLSYLRSLIEGRKERFTSKYLEAKHSQWLRDKATSIRNDVFNYFATDARHTFELTWQNLAIINTNGLVNLVNYFADLSKPRLELETVNGKLPYPTPWTFKSGDCLEIYDAEGHWIGLSADFFVDDDLAPDYQKNVEQAAERLVNAVNESEATSSPKWLVDAILDMQELNICPMVYNSSDRIQSAINIAEKMWAIKNK